MPIKVLVVDDSAFFRRQITKILEEDPQITIIDTAVDGRDAVEKASKLHPDVITMDVEMPVMNGIDATREIMQKNPIPILMFSSLTVDGAKSTLDALSAGAVDFLPKRFEDITLNKEDAKKILCERVRAIAGQRVAKINALYSKPPAPKPAAPKSGVASAAPAPTAQPTPATPRPAAASSGAKKGHFSVVAIGTSTGGPIALQNVLTHLPKSFPLPILLVQHMPGTFTPAFAHRLNEMCEIGVKEAQDGDVLEPGKAYLAPGGKQMTIKKRGAQAVISISEAAPAQTYKPCVDITFKSVAESFPNSTLAIVLTGMGADGREGARLLKQGGSTVWAQNEATCVVYGMPAAIVDAGLADKVLGLPDIGEAIAHEV
jgi:two-component system chemotaxis response regulator CheB